MSRSRKAALFAGVPAALLLCGVVAAHDYIAGAAFVVKAAGIQGVARSAANVESNAFTETVTTVPWRGGTLRARVYRPSVSFERAVLLVPGVHADGIDEPRMVGFARDLASARHAVLSVELPDLARYSITPRTTDMIEDAAQYLLTQKDLVTDGRIGMMGISFAGGLSIVAAGRPSIRDHVAFVMSFGGHGDLPRTLRYLCTGEQPDGTHRPPHDYGVAIILLGVADRVVPSEQAQPLRGAILAYLDASKLDMYDKAKAEQEFARATHMAAALPEPAHALMAYVNQRDVTHLGPILLPHVTVLGADPALSAARAPAPCCPVYLLHGTDDNVIPASESALLAETLRAHGVEVHRLATPLITHAEVDRSATTRAIWALVRFWGDLLDE
jgi:dienelactone hydrolase